jgi:hypothetical protein
VGEGGREDDGGGQGDGKVQLGRLRMETLAPGIKDVDVDEDVDLVEGVVDVLDGGKELTTGAGLGVVGEGDVGGNGGGVGEGTGGGEALSEFGARGKGRSVRSEGAREVEGSVADRGDDGYGGVLGEWIRDARDVAVRNSNRLHHLVVALLDNGDAAKERLAGDVVEAPVMIVVPELEEGGVVVVRATLLVPVDRHALGKMGSFLAVP